MEKNFIKLLKYNKRILLNQKENLGAWTHVKEVILLGVKYQSGDEIKYENILTLEHKKLLDYILDIRGNRSVIIASIHAYSSTDEEDKENKTIAKERALAIKQYFSDHKDAQYSVPHCQDHLKKILIPPIYDTLSNMSIASNS